jgi:hypothetical protein
MTDLAVLVAIALPTLLVGLVAGLLLSARGRRARAAAPVPERRILLPFTGTSISRRSLEAAVRLARAEDAIIMPTFLATVPRHLTIDAPLSAQCLQAMPLLEAIEQKAIAAGVHVDARVGRGRSYRDALKHVIDAEPVDRIIVSASTNPRRGLNAQDLQWLLAKAPTEVLILRPGPDDASTITAATIAGHF